MGYLVTRMKSGNMSYSGTQYVNPTSGTKRLCIRTGTKPTDVVKYGLTTNSSASNYCGMRMKINGKTAYIGRSEAPIITNSAFNSEISSKRGSSTYQTYYKTIKYTSSYSSTASNAYTRGWAYGTYTYTSSIITSVNDKQCTQLDKYRTMTYYVTIETTITIARSSTVHLSRSINYYTAKAITRNLLFSESLPQDENNFNL